MEKLQLRSDGISETPTGMLAVLMFYAAGRNSEKAWFAFRTKVDGDSIRIEWPTTTNIVLLTQEIGQGIVNLKYGRYLTVDEVDQYNDAVDFHLASNPDPETGDPESPAFDPANGSSSSPLGDDGLLGGVTVAEGTEPPPPAPLAPVSQFAGSTIPVATDPPPAIMPVADPVATVVLTPPPAPAIQPPGPAIMQPPTRKK